MDIIYTWAAGLIGASVIGTLVCLLAPSGKNERLMRTLSAVFVITAAFSPLLAKSGAHAEALFPQAADNHTADISRSVERQGEIAVRAAVREILVSSGIDDYEIYVSVSADAQGNARLENLEVVLAEGFADQKDDVYSLLEKAFPGVCTVRVAS